MIQSVLRWAVLASVSVLLVGCSTTVGSPLPATSSTSGSAASTATLPSRPRDLKVDQVDPCLLLGKSQQQELGTDREPRRATKPDQHGNIGCAFTKSNSRPYFDYAITAVPQEGADVWLRGDRNVLVKTLTVAGYGAIELRITENDIACDVVVDVAPGQSLEVNLMASSDAMSTDEKCVRAKQAAEFAVTTLATLK